LQKLRTKFKHNSVEVISYIKPYPLSFDRATTVQLGATTVQWWFFENHIGKGGNEASLELDKLWWLR